MSFVVVIGKWAGVFVERTHIGSRVILGWFAFHIMRFDFDELWVDLVDVPMVRREIIKAIRRQKGTRSDFGGV